MRPFVGARWWGTPPHQASVHATGQLIAIADSTDNTLIMSQSGILSPREHVVPPVDAVRVLVADPVRAAFASPSIGCSPD